MNATLVPSRGAVMLFFVLSGYVLALPYIEGRPLSWWRFLISAVLSIVATTRGCRGCYDRALFICSAARSIYGRWLGPAHQSGIGIPLLAAVRIGRRLRIVRSDPLESGV